MASALRTVLVLLALVASAASTGCGGSTAKTHDFDALVSCVRGLGLDASTAKARLDLIAEKAQEGGIDINFSDNHATVDVESTPGAAESVKKQYETFASRLGGGIDQRGNVVVAWDKTAAPGEASELNGCIDKS